MILIAAAERSKRSVIGLDLTAPLYRQADVAGLRASGYGSGYSSIRIQRTPCIWRRVVASDLHSNRLAGGCQCGAVRYEIRGEPVSLYVCHCRECQKQSASAFGVSAIVKRWDFHLTQGEVKVWSRATDSGGTLACAFCPACGSRVWHEGIGPTDTISVKGGSLDAPPDLRSAVQI